MNTALNRTTILLLTNKSGSGVNQGDTVVVDTANAAAFMTTTTSGYVTTPVGIVLEPNGIANNATGLIAFGGYVPKVNLSASASLGDFFKSHTVAGEAVRHNAPAVAGDFGIVLGTGTTPAAVLFGVIQSAGGGGGAATSDHFVVGQGGEGDTDLSAKIIIPRLTADPDIRVAGANDDEFDVTDTSDPMTGWTTIGTPTAHDINSTIKSHYYVKRNGAAGVNLTGICKATPGAPFTVTAKIAGITSTSDYNLGGLMIGEASPGKLNTIEIAHSANAYVLKCEPWTNPTTSAGAAFYTGATEDGRTPIYFRIVVHSSTNVDYAWSPDGLIWNTIVAARNPGFTVGSAGLVISPTGTGNAVEMAVDWIRFS